MRERSAFSAAPPAAVIASLTRAGAVTLTTPGAPTAPETWMTIAADAAALGVDFARADADGCSDVDGAGSADAPALVAAMCVGGIATTSDRWDIAAIAPDRASTRSRMAANRKERPSSTNRRFLADDVSAPISSPAPIRIAVRIKLSTFAQLGRPPCGGRCMAVRRGDGSFMGLLSSCTRQAPAAHPLECGYSPHLGHCGECFRQRRRFARRMSP